MELRRFEQFITLAEEGSFTAAARKLFMAQSSLSGSIATLEQELGAVLFTRRHRGVELTGAGRELLEPAREAIAAAHRAKRAVAGRLTVSRPLRIADTFATEGLHAEKIAESMCQRHPGLQIQITHFGLRNVTDKVIDGEVDVALTPIAHPLPESVEHISLGATPLALLCGVGHRLAGASAVTIADLADERFLTMPGDSAVRDHSIRAMDTLAERGPVRIAVDSWLNAVSLVRRGYGITAGPQYLTDFYPPDIAVATLANPPMMESAIVLPRHDRHPAAAEYAQACRAEIEH